MRSLPTRLRAAASRVPGGRACRVRRRSIMALVERDAIDRFLDQQRGRFLDELCELCAIPSEAKDPDALERAARWCRGRLAAAGCAVRERRGGAVPPLVIGETRAGARTLIALQHYDLQPAVPLHLWA